MNYSVTVYINPNCGPCKELKKWLNEKEISFTEKDIVNDEKAYEEFKEANQIFTPFTVIQKEGKKHNIVGGHKKRIEKILFSGSLFK